MRGPRLKLLLVEDDANDVELLQLAFRATPGLRLDVVFNGREAIESVTAEAATGNGPDLILCDLNMPVMNGFEFLSWLKRDSPCPRTPLVVLTSSVVDADVVKAYDAGAAAYLVKPSNHEDLISLAKALVDFWKRVHAPGLKREE